MRFHLRIHTGGNNDLNMQIMEADAHSQQDSYFALYFAKHVLVKTGQ